MEPNFNPEERAEQKISGGSFACSAGSTEGLGGESAGLSSGKGGEKAKEYLSVAMNQLSQGIESMRENARQRVQSAAVEQRGRAIETMKHVSNAVHDTASTLSREGNQTLAQYADKLGNQIDKVTGYLQEHEPDELLQEASKYVSRNIGVFVGGMLLAGVVVAQVVYGRRRPENIVSEEVMHEPHTESGEGRRVPASSFTPQTSRFTEQQGEMPGQ